MGWIPMSERDLKRIEVLSEVMSGRCDEQVDAVALRSKREHVVLLRGA